MAKVKLTKVKRTDRVAKGSGKPFVSLGIMTEQHGDKWLSGFDSPETAKWQVGDTVEIEIQTNGDYLNFKLPKKVSSHSSEPTGDYSAKVLNYLTFKITPMLQEILEKLPKSIDYPEYIPEKHDGRGIDRTADEINSDDVPF